MVRKTALVTAMLGAFASQTFAMGLGDIRLNSVLNQPLLAEVELLSPTAADLAALRVSLASNEAYTKAGVERAFFHTKLRFEVVSRPNGSAVIKITSREAVREPYLDFLLEATWGSGQVLREYTVLVDPPALMPAPKPVMRAPVAATAPTATPAPRATTSAAAPSASATTTSSGAVTGEYTVTRSDTLWGVATAVRPDSDVSMEQTMLGLLEANPSAFYDQNINNLKAGYVLRVPSREEMTAISQKEALAETRRQNALWREGRTAQTKAVAAEAAPAPAAATPDTTAAAAAVDPQLKLVAPETDAASSTGSEATVEGLRKDLALAVESVEAQRQENQDLNTRLKQLEDQLSQLHRMIELKDNQAAQLAGTATPATETPDAAAVTPETATPDTEAAAPVTDAMPAADAESAQMPESAPDAGTEVIPETADAATDAPMQDEVASEPESVPVPTPVIQEKSVEDESMPQPVEEPGLLESLMANPMFKWAAAGGAILIALLAWLGMRRSREDDSDFQESILAERHAKVTAAAPNYVAPAAAAAATPKKSAAEAPTKDPAQTDSSLFTDFAVSDMGQIHNDAEADPVAEADVYLAYGRYQQAEELIRNALNRAPQRSDLKLKLLEVLFAAKNANSFDSEAEGFLASLGNPDGEEWQRVVEMGLELNPTNPLYGAVGGTAAADKADSDLDFSADSAGAAEPDTGMDFAAETDNSLDFDMGDLDSFAPKTDEISPSMPVEEDLSFDLSGDDMEDAGEGTLASSDEVATKLDLARAYIEMGDPEGARSILDEVMQEGDAAQKSEAQSLLKDMS
ncbi:MAG: hypothetical protein KKE76_14030 [Gammaproteobacteria bacterium]|nr:hypothetical protein [Gammaproteobacteria bacterium]